MSIQIVKCMSTSRVWSMTDLNNKLTANDNFENIPSYGHPFNVHVLKIQ